MKRKETIEAILIASILLDGKIPIYKWNNIDPENISKRFRDIYKKMLDLSIDGTRPTYNSMLAFYESDKLDEIIDIATQNSAGPLSVDEFDAIVKNLKTAIEYERIVNIADEIKRNASNQAMSPESIAADAIDKIRNISTDSGGMVTIRDAFQSMSSDPGKPYSIPMINNVYVTSGKLVIISGPTSIGKTTFWLNWVHGAADKYGDHVLIFDFEMGRDHILRKLLAINSGISADVIRNDYYTMKNREEFFEKYSDAIENLSNMNILINSEFGDTRLDITRKAMEYKMKNDRLDFVIVDYAQIVNSPMSDGDSPAHKMSLLARDMLLLAKELNCVVILASQLSRNADRSGNPKLSDLKESSSLEQFADTVILLKYMNGRPTTTMNYYDVIAHVAKNRDGRTGEFNLRYYPDKQKFVQVMI